MINHIESIYQIPMSMTTNENYIYEIRSIDSRVNVVNGKRYKFNKDNKDLLIQMLEDI